MFTFSAANLPERVHVGYGWVPVHPYIKNPTIKNSTVILEKLVCLLMLTAADARERVLVYVSGCKML